MLTEPEMDPLAEKYLIDVGIVQRSSWAWEGLTAYPSDATPDERAALAVECADHLPLLLELVEMMLAQSHKQAEQIQRVREMHEHVEIDPMDAPCRWVHEEVCEWCNVCDVHWPCPTIKAVDG